MLSGSWGASYDGSDGGLASCTHPMRYCGSFLNNLCYFTSECELLMETESKQPTCVSFWFQMDCLTLPSTFRPTFLLICLDWSLLRRTGLGGLAWGRVWPEDDLVDQEKEKPHTVTESIFILRIKLKQKPITATAFFSYIIAFHYPAHSWYPQSRLGEAQLLKCGWKWDLLLMLQCLRSDSYKCGMIKPQPDCLPLSEHANANANATLLLRRFTVVSRLERQTRAPNPLRWPKWMKVVELITYDIKKDDIWLWNQHFMSWKWQMSC